jgi:thiosulfate/3-mercaptopyruvate sulfurtransferase
MNLPPIITADALIDLTATSSPDSAVIVCDVRWYLDRRPGLAAYQSGHIPDAIFVDLDEHLTAPPRRSAGRHPLPAAATFAASLSALGIGPQDTVVAYDDAGGMSAGRLVWMLRILGQPAALLDGGIQHWTGPLETVTRTRPSIFCPIREWPNEIIVDADTTAAAAADSSTLVLDARAPERYRGETEPVDPRAGHIPGAANHPFATNLGEDGTFLTADELRARFLASGVTATDDPANAPIIYCGSGVSACHNLLAIEHAGLGTARLYPGSWSQWANDDSRVAATGN